MEQSDLKYFVDRYDSRLRQYGYSPEALGWGKHGRQETRFEALSQSIVEMPDSSVLDVGCGFADLYDYLVAQGWKGAYCGIDITPGLLSVAKVRHPDLDFRRVDITASDHNLERYDYVLASGLFNTKLKVGCNRDHIKCALQNMFRLARIAVCVDFLSTYVDFKLPESWHTDPAWAFTLAKALSKKVALRHDYMPYEFALLIYIDDKVSMRNVFETVES